MSLSAAFDTHGELSRKPSTGGALPVRAVIGPDNAVRWRTAGYTGFEAGFAAVRVGKYEVFALPYFFPVTVSVPNMPAA